MAVQRTESSLPNLIGKLAKMTAIRDTYLVEQSLLRTLGPLLGVMETSLYRADDSGTVLRTLHYSRKTVAEQDGTYRASEKIEEATNDQGMPDAVRVLLDNIRLLNRPCNSKVGNNFLIGYPLKGGDELLGYFVCSRDREVSPSDDAVVNGVLEVFSNYYTLLDTSQRDSLTGLLNRYSLELNLDRLWYLLAAHLRDSNDGNLRRHQDSRRYWIGILDIDNFKNINDTFGHMIGDEVLIIAARLLQSSLRHSDLLYRYGGEEFVTIIAANDLVSAEQVFERMRRKIEQFQFPQVGQVTISGGFNGADPMVLPREVINRADSALYEAKKVGRNRIFHYDTLIDQGILSEIPSGSIDLF